MFGRPVFLRRHSWPFVVNTVLLAVCGVAFSVAPSVPACVSFLVALGSHTVLSHMLQRQVRQAFDVIWLYGVGAKTPASQLVIDPLPIDLSDTEEATSICTLWAYGGGGK